MTRVTDFRGYISRNVMQQDRGHSSPCWIWQGAVSRNGYGHVCVNGFNRAHRLAAWIYHPQFHADLTIDHLCRQKLCCNPAHLEQVTLRENIRRSFASRPRKPVCINGHQRSPENLNTQGTCRLCLAERRKRLVRGRIVA